jgi:hypothetical protein
MLSSQHGLLLVVVVVVLLLTLLLLLMAAAAAGVAQRAARAYGASCTSAGAVQCWSGCTQ